MAEKKPPFTWSNFWYYYKWWVIIGAALLISFGALLIRNLTAVKPDYQIAWVGDYPLPEEKAETLERALTALGEDVNGDGRVVVQVNQYPTLEKVGDGEAALGKVGSETRLMADLLDSESYLFLLEYPEVFQRQYEILDPQRVDGGVLDSSLSGLILARREFQPGREPQALSAWASLWDRMTGGQT